MTSSGASQIELKGGSVQKCSQIRLCRVDLADLAARMVQALLWQGPLACQQALDISLEFERVERWTKAALSDSVAIHQELCTKYLNVRQLMYWSLQQVSLAIAQLACLSAKCTTKNKGIQAQSWRFKTSQAQMCHD